MTDSAQQTTEWWDPRISAPTPKAPEPPQAKPADEWSDYDGIETDRPERLAARDRKLQKELAPLIAENKALRAKIKVLERTISDLSWAAQNAREDAERLRYIESGGYQGG